jgi:serine/threonine protein kinase
MSEARKPSSKNKKKKSFNNTTKLSSHFVTPVWDQYVMPITTNSKYTMSINTNRHANMSINLSNNRSGAKCHMLSKISTPKANAVGRKYNRFENKSNVVSPPSSTKNSEPRGHFFNFPGTTKARAKGINATDMMAAIVHGASKKKNKSKNFKNMSGPIQFEKSQSVWNHNFSGLSHNSSSSRVGTKDIKQTKPSTSNTRTSEKYETDANREMMKKITSDNKYFAILKKITQDTGRHYSYTNSSNNKYHKYGDKGSIKEYEVVDSSGGTADNLSGAVTASHKSERRMYGTEKIDIKKYNNILANAPIMIDHDHDDEINEIESPEKLKYPITAGKTLKLFSDKLSDYEKNEILDYKNIYFLGKDADKILSDPLSEHNYGFDDERGDYNVVVGDHIAFRFEIIDFLGKGSFGQALKWFDHKRKNFIALKIIRNKKKFQYQASVEVKILRHLRENDPNDENNIIRLKDSFIFRKHIWITFELLSINLYEFIKSNEFQGVSLGLIRRFAIQILQGLRYSRQQKIIHWDLKPENILLKNINKSGIKIIDFGSGCFDDERVYTYIQSRFYRAPEIILGIPYTSAIDMWSCGCILSELFWGYPVFAGESEMDQLGLIMELWGIPDDDVLEQSTRKNLFFSDDNQPALKPNSRGKMRKPNTKSITSVLRWTDNAFIDFLQNWFIWDPRKRMTPDEALMHPWILEGLPPKVLAQHKKILGIRDPKKNYTPHSISNDGTSVNRSQLRNDNGWMKQRKSSLNSKNNPNNISISRKEKQKMDKDKSFWNTENMKGVSNYFKEDGDVMTLPSQNYYK